MATYQFNPFTGNLDIVGLGGGAATPGGSDTQVQFNDGGSFAGDSGLTYNDIAGALTVGGKTATTDAPILNLSQTWNNAATTFTGLKLNVTDTASAADSKLLNLQRTGTSIFSITGGTAPALEFKHTLSAKNLAILPQSAGQTLIQAGSNQYAFLVRDTELSLKSDVSITFRTGQVHNTSADVGLARDSAGVVKVTNGSTGTGYLKLVPTTVGALTAAATVGAGTKAFVTDSTSTLSSHHGQVVVGGGSNFVPVFSDGTNWIVG